MGQGKYERRLVGLVDRAQEVCLAWVALNEEAREVVLVVFDVVFKNLHAVHAGCLGVADGRHATQLEFADVLGCAGGVVGLDGFQRGMVAEILAALHECDGVGVHFGDGVPVVVGQTTDAMGDVKFVFAYYGGS